MVSSSLPNLGTLELHIDTTDDTSEEECLRPQHEKKKRRLGDNPKWTRADAHYTGWSKQTHGADLRANRMKTKFTGHSPVDFVSSILDEEILLHIVRESCTYAKQKNEHGFTLTATDLQKFIGVLLLSGYHKLPSQRQYWSLDEDLGVACVKECMTRDRFLQIKRFLHLANNDNIGNTNDKMFKVRPLTELLNKRFMQHGIFHTRLSVDESMVKYFGRHSCKQFIRGKPIRFGYKNWMLCSADGYCYAFETYCGKALVPQEGPLGTRVVLSLLKNIETPSDHTVFFDNFFTSHELLTSLREKGIRATGTIRESRQKKCPLPSRKEMQKKSRGEHDCCFDSNNEILLVKWKDNSVVTMATNYDSVNPLGTVRRYSSEKKSKAPVQQPRLFKTYNSGMGGVDLADQAINNYRIGIRGKKWWWVLFTQMVNLAVVNAWKLHSQASDTPLDLLSFTRNVTRYYLRLGVKTSTFRRGPPTVPGDVVRDGPGHFPIKLEKQLRCRVCHGRSKWSCEKCASTLCLERECFKQFHVVVD